LSCILNDYLNNRRTLWNGRVEIIYISSSQVVIKSVPEEGVSFFHPVVIRTHPGLEIETVKDEVDKQ
jgi:hypothetical protein